MERENEAMVCPYDRNHIIHNSRIQRHLIKCARNYPPEYKVTCPYNATHLLFKDDMMNHMATCSDRKYINPERFTFALKNYGSIKSCLPSEAASTICSETWDEQESSDAATNEEGSVVSNAESIPPPILPILPKRRLGPLRPPFTQSEISMLEPPDESVIDDNESIISAVSGAGRGRMLAQKIRHLAMIGQRPPMNYDTARVGMSAVTDISDGESIISERGFGRGSIRIRYN